MSEVKSSNCQSPAPFQHPTVHDKLLSQGARGANHWASLGCTAPRRKDSLLWEVVETVGVRSTVVSPMKVWINPYPKFIISSCTMCMIYIYYIYAHPPPGPIHEVFFWPDCRLHISYLTFTSMPANLNNVAIMWIINSKRWKVFVRKSTDLFKKNYLKEEGSGLRERVYVVKIKAFFKQPTHLFIKEGDLY